MDKHFRKYDTLKQAHNVKYSDEEISMSDEDEPPIQIPRFQGDLTKSNFAQQLGMSSMYDQGGGLIAGYDSQTASEMFEMKKSLDNSETFPVNNIIKYIKQDYDPGSLKASGLEPLAGHEFDLLMMNMGKTPELGFCADSGKMISATMKQDLREILEDYSPSGSGNEQVEQISRNKEPHAIDWNHSLGGTSQHSTKRNREHSSRFEYFLYNNMDNIRNFKFIWIVALVIGIYYGWY